MNDRNLLKRIICCFEEIRDNERMYFINKYGLLGTDRVDDMLGKVGFIDKNGRYYPVRKVIANDDKNSDDDIITHDEWARMYIRYILKRNGNCTFPVAILLRRFGFVFLIEGMEDYEELHVVGNIVSDEQRRSIDRLKKHTKTLKKER